MGIKQIDFKLAFIDKMAIAKSWFLNKMYKEMQAIKFMPVVSVVHDSPKVYILKEKKQVAMEVACYQFQDKNPPSLSLIQIPFETFIKTNID